MSAEIAMLLELPAESARLVGSEESRPSDGGGFERALDAKMRDTDLRDAGAEGGGAGSASSEESTGSGALPAETAFVPEREAGDERAAPTENGGADEQVAQPVATAPEAQAVDPLEQALLLALHDGAVEQAPEPVVGAERGATGEAWDVAAGRTAMAALAYEDGDSAAAPPGLQRGAGRPATPAAGAGAGGAPAAASEAPAAAFGIGLADGASNPTPPGEGSAAGEPRPGLEPSAPVLRGEGLPGAGAPGQAVDSAGSPSTADDRIELAEQAATSRASGAPESALREVAARPQAAEPTRADLPSVPRAGDTPQASDASAASREDGSGLGARQDGDAERRGAAERDAYVQADRERTAAESSSRRESISPATELDGTLTRVEVSGASQAGTAAAAAIGGIAVAEAGVVGAPPAPAAPSAGTPPLPSPPEAIPVQTEWLAVRGGGTARLELHPAELGPLHIRVTVRGDEVRVVMMVQEPAAVVAANDSRDALAQNLAARDLRMEHFEVRGIGDGDGPDTSREGRSGGAADSREGSERGGREGAAGRGGQAGESAPADAVSGEARVASRASARDGVDLRI